MSLNLHAAVRGAINPVKQDIPAWWAVSSGYTTDAAGKRTPTFTIGASVQIQEQPPSYRDLQHINMLNLQGVVRTVFLYSNPNGVNRVNVKGGDLLLFPQWLGAPMDFWLVTRPDEQWDVTPGGGWTKLYATLQTDRNYTIVDAQQRPVLDAKGHMVTSI